MKRSFLVVIPLFTFLAFFPFQCEEEVKDGGLYKSEDMGETWEQQTVKDKDFSIASLDVLSLAVDPNDSDTLYLGSRENGIYKSCCAGEHWYKLEDKNGLLSSRATVYDMVVDPKDSDRLYIGIYQNRKGRFFRSQDGGESWQEVYVVSKENFAVFAVAVDNQDSSVVYMGTAQGGLLKSTDYGKSWQLIKWFDDAISDIAINPYDTRIVYVSTFKKGIYKTSDKGENWESFKKKLKEFRQSQKVERLVLDPQRPDIIYAGSAYGLLVSKDGGENWQEVEIIMPPKTVPVLSLAIDPLNTDHLYYGAGPVLYRSLDQGKNWTVHELSSKRSVKAIAIDPKNPNLVYAGMHK